MSYDESSRINVTILGLSSVTVPAVRRAGATLPYIVVQEDGQPPKRAYPVDSYEIYGFNIGYERNERNLNNHKHVVVEFDDESVASLAFDPERGSWYLQDLPWLADRLRERRDEVEREYYESLRESADASCFFPLDFGDGADMVSDQMRLDELDRRLDWRPGD